MLARLARPDTPGKKTLRLAAWRVLANGESSFEPFDCDTCCGRRGENTGERQLRGCTRTDLDPVEWDVDPERIQFHLGRSGDDPFEPIEDGCPGGYARAPLLVSLMRYYRAPTRDGGRVANPHLDRCDDALILDAVVYLELEEQRCENERVRSQSEWRAKNGS
jgi:hypothetical protein